jgi:hypothetical protein
MAADVAAGGADAPAFFFHLGDVVYYFGEGRYYYDQFYEPFRGYNRPIFAIPGNHDDMMYGAHPNTPTVPTMEAFSRNFCAAKPGLSPDAQTLVRNAATWSEVRVSFNLAVSVVRMRRLLHMCSN